jgi:hypothetical protein
MMLDADALIRKHRGKGVLVDANLLVLLIVGLVNPDRIEHFKRTAVYTSSDFELLVRLINHLGEPIVSTPHILSQVSDLAKLSGNEFAEGRHILKHLISQMKEHYDPSSLVTQNQAFDRLGLCDAAIAELSASGVVVLTADLDLHLTVQSVGFDSINFNHVRQMEWEQE